MEINAMKTLEKDLHQYCRTKTAENDKTKHKGSTKIEYRLRRPMELVQNRTTDEVTKQHAPNVKTQHAFHTLGKSRINNNGD